MAATWGSLGGVLGAALFYATVDYSPVILPTQSSQWYYPVVLLPVVILIAVLFGSKNLVRQETEETTGQEEACALSD